MFPALERRKGDEKGTQPLFKDPSVLLLFRKKKDVEGLILWYQNQKTDKYKNHTFLWVSGKAKDGRVI